MSGTFDRRIVFAGTPVFAAVALEALLGLQDVTVVAVYTQPDRPAGRGRKPAASPVKALALAHDVEVRQPESLKTGTALTALQDLAPTVMIVAAYGLLLPSDVLAVPRLGCINIHASLLPRWRGAAPIQRAILAGDTETGISLMQMEAGLDTGPVLTRTACPIDPADTAQSLHDRLAHLGAAALVRALPDILANTLTAEPQDERQASYAAKISREEAALDFALPAVDIARAVRGYFPKPKATAIVEGQTMQILAAEPLPMYDGRFSPGTLVPHDRELLVATGRGVLCVKRLQLPGRRPVSGTDYRNALRQSSH